MAGGRLTKTLVENMLAGERDTYVWDASLAGFGLKVTPSGKRVYLVQYRPRLGPTTRRYTLGPHGNPWTTEKAREAAKDLLARVRLGEDPHEVDSRRREAELAQLKADLAAKAEAEAATARDAAEAFEKVVDQFILKYAKPKNRRWRETQRILSSSDLAGWKGRPVGGITKRDVVALIDQVSERSHGAARLLFVHLRKFFGWCVERLIIEHSPCGGLRGPALSRPRDRVLTDDELVRVWAACDIATVPFDTLVRLLLLTGQRREEVTGMRWSELDFKTGVWTLPAERTKNGKAHAVDLSPPAQTLLEQLRARRERRLRKLRDLSEPQRIKAESDFVFTTTGVTSVSGHTKIKRRIDEQVAKGCVEDGVKAVPAWRIHDLRRTAATGMARLGCAPYVVEAVLNHSSGVRGGLIAVYQHYNHRPERKLALERWGAHVVELIGEGALD